MGWSTPSFGLTPRSAIDLDPATTVLVGVRDRQVYKIDIGEEDTVNLVPTDGDFDGSLLLDLVRQHRGRHPNRPRRGSSPCGF